MYIEKTQKNPSKTLHSVMKRISWNAITRAYTEISLLAATGAPRMFFSETQLSHLSCWSVIFLMLSQATKFSNPLPRINNQIVIVEVTLCQWHYSIWVVQHSHHSSNYTGILMTCTACKKRLCHSKTIRQHQCKWLN